MDERQADRRAGEAQAGAEELRLPLAAELSPLRVAVAGSSGLIGSALCDRLTMAGHSVIRLVRRTPQAGTNEVHWDPRAGQIDSGGLLGIDAVINLAGENIAGRWTAARKRAIRDSRIKGTRLLSAALAGLDSPPAVLINASATGFYGDRGADMLVEHEPAGTGFLAELCREWEAATEPAQRAGLRVAHPRLGVVLDPLGGALRQLIPLFERGLGGVLGSGEQYLPWITLSDAIEALLHLLRRDELRGAVNVTAPEPVTNRQFTHVLAEVLGRRVGLTAPAFALRLLLGEMADQTLLSGQRAIPARLIDSGFVFRWPKLEPALLAMLSPVDLSGVVPPED